MELTQYEIDSLQRLGESIYNGRWSNAGLVELIELAGSALNLMPVAVYSKATGISYQGAIKDTNDRLNKNIFDTKMIIDNY